MRPDEHNPVLAGPDSVRAVGVVLAGGAGRRFGMPKALARADDGSPWVQRACRALLDGGCADVVVVLGARADEARELVPATARFVVAADWATGIAASLRAGLAAAAELSVAQTGAAELTAAQAGAGELVVPETAAGQAAADATVVREALPDVAVVTLVDLPDLRADAVRRVLGVVGGSDAARHTLARAVYGGLPGHPVLVGRAHWNPLAAAVHGDTGAGPYLRTHGVAAVDCTDLGGGDDVDQRG